MGIPCLGATTVVNFNKVAIAAIAPACMDNPAGFCSIYGCTMAISYINTLVSPATWSWSPIFTTITALCWLYHGATTATGCKGYRLGTLGDYSANRLLGNCFF